MQCGLYGKLPAKRDFIAVAAPQEFLALWEFWIQGAMSASTLKLGGSWRAAFLRAPIWRFWLGAELCGRTVVGAFMPSLDGIGRYFPLTLFARADEKRSFPPPELEPQVKWFTMAEKFLLSMLEESVNFDATSASLAELEHPADWVASVPRKTTVFLNEGSLIMWAGADSFSDIFASARVVDHASVYAGCSYWWTAGGEGFPAIALARRRMPDPNVFTGMLTGDFGYLEK